MLAASTATSRLCPLRNDRPAPVGRYPSVAIDSFTRFTVCTDALLVTPLTTRETVAIETPACAATAEIETVSFFGLTVRAGSISATVTGGADIFFLEWVMLGFAIVAIQFSQVHNLGKRLPNSSFYCTLAIPE